jgi:hypothetical protein
MEKGLLNNSSRIFYLYLFNFSYASGAEDGLVRIHYFDNDYLDYDVAY